MNYELLYIVHPDLESTSDKITSKVKNLISSAEGKVDKEDIWGKRKLAYKVEKNDFGIYVLLNFSLAPEKLNKALKELRLQEEILRFMVTKESKEAETKEEIKEFKETKPAEPVIEEEKIEEVKEIKKIKEEEKVKEKEKEKKVKVEKPQKPLPAVKKEKPKTPEVSEEERLKEIDKKLKEILGDSHE